MDWFPHIGWSTWIFGMIGFLGIYNYIAKMSWKNLPPGPWCLPLLGSVPFMKSLTDIRVSLRSLAENYGNIFTLYLGGKRAVVLTGYDIIKEAFVKNNYVFSGRSDFFVLDYFRKRRGIGIADGKDWQIQKQYVVHTLKNLGMGKSIMEQHINAEIDVLLKSLRNNLDKPIDPRAIIQKANAAIVLALLTGDRKKYDDEEFNEMLRSIQDVGHFSSFNNPVESFPILRFIPGDPFQWNKLVSAYKCLNRIYQKYIDDHKQLCNESEPTDLVSAYLQKISEERNIPDSSFVENQLVRVVDDVMEGGAETTSTTLSWGITYMIMYPSVAQRIKEEIKDVIGYDRLPRLSDRKIMPYTEACISELQRIADITPLAIPHRTLEDIDFRDYHIPKGTCVIANIHSIHHDPSIWPDPETFKPERFLDQNGMYQKREELIPFSLGKRTCPGQGLAQMELFLIFTTLMQQFTFRLPEGHPPLTTEGILGMTHCPKPFKIILQDY